MNTSESYNKWLESAYCFFAEKGLEKLSIKALAEKCGLPRTNFYYHFENKEELINKTIELHFKSTTKIFNKELNKRCHSFIPDLFIVVCDFKLGFQFAKQLFKNRENLKFNAAYNKSVALSADLIAPKFREYFNIDLDHESTKALWFTLTDTWYSRLNFNNFSVDSLCALCYEIIDTILPLIEKGSLPRDIPHFSFDTPV